jgi:hypothetical protein
MPLRPNL